MMHELNSSRLLSERDHPDIFGMAAIGKTVDDVVAYARRPKSEVVSYLRRCLPQTYEGLIRNEKQKAQ